MYLHLSKELPKYLKEKMLEIFEAGKRFQSDDGDYNFRTLSDIKFVIKTTKSDDKIALAFNDRGEYCCVNFQNLSSYMQKDALEYWINCVVRKEENNLYPIENCTLEETISFCNQSSYAYKKNEEKEEQELKKNADMIKAMSRLLRASAASGAPAPASSSQLNQGKKDTTKE